ncbi:MAG: crotonase/enoyl-CoA hydratase family protein [Desulfobacteraceae bacterium]|nr:enoyl-CoA hydratase/isomerase family protein [Desulfobacteraceae bacterium]MBC2757299.1 crotonase/enoyl-CoA hydratase family protein [Desulfobacteraceae bacterium]
MPLIYEKKDGIAYITLNRPEAQNSFDPETVVEIVDAWKDYRDDDSLRCAILTGAGDKIFSSGADLKRLIPLITGARPPETEADKLIHKDPYMTQNAFLRNFKLYKPIVAAINGTAIAGGMEILYATDIRVAAEGTKFGLQEVKWSIVPLMGTTVKLPRQIPYAKAMEIMLTGELIDAEEALALGFINKIVPKDQVMAEAERYAKIIVKNGPLAVKAVKQSALEGIGLSLKEGLAKELEIGIPVFLSEDAKEGPKAFKEKREPNFKGK